MTNGCESLLTTTSTICSFSDQHDFSKPNDVRALRLMDRAATHLMEEFPDIVLGFGESDEYR